MAGKHKGLIKQAINYLNHPAVRNRAGGGTRMSAERLRHQQVGGITYSKKDNALTATGYHHRPGGVDHPGRRIGPVGDRWDNGVYSATIEIKNPKPPPPWVPKLTTDGKSTFFPNDWSAERIDDATSEAFRTSVSKDAAKGTWKGFADGVWIEGRYDPATGNIGHGFPSGNQQTGRP
ncbi:EndoU domain-containing protein [Glycomyces harbinensis]|uniref:EndoU nuclease n=1 Tax=Glycomyces harbinensis TaxID=58114 RepID=A0A1G6V8F0_9ACTN|nr:EndoU domain-containing protein [Glycomyces harbinensis]SDD49970.1 EndoU nuclease [Glycomyces harbinensis]